ncbi:MAG: hypothetical protein KGI41_03405 [Patescibacteria group bacterium]|nr:hypothetical protein [Patescibacteria group bacterium]MDE1966257.1 hypothetical protein [Patescibacteria group bacterium]
MARRIATGIDIGTHQVKIVVTEEVHGPDGARMPRIIATGLAESKGLRHGYVVNRTDVAESIIAAKREAERGAGFPVKSAFLAIGGASLDELRATGETVIARADQEVTDMDLAATENAARETIAPALINRIVLHVIPVAYRLDGAPVLGGTPRGMKGTRLSVDYVFVTALSQHVEALVGAVEDADIEVVDKMASPLAGSNVLLTKDQKMKGCVLANIGAETVSIVVFDYGIPLSVKMFSIGSTSITDDIALGLRIPLDEAERLKLGKLGGAMYPRKKIEEIIAARLSAMFDLIDKHLKVIGRRGLLPAGIALSGGGAGAGSISDIARHSLALPARIAELRLPPDTKLRDSTWAVAYGLTLWGLTGETDIERKGAFASLGHTLRRFVRQFLP